jgi:aspartate/methionine/tyrosine aminotransferase
MSQSRHQRKVSLHISNMSLNLAIIQDPLVVVRFPSLASYGKHASNLLEHCADQSFFSVTCTPTETSVVLPESFHTFKFEEEIKVESGWCTIRVEGPLDFSLIGILSKLATTLAEVSVSIFVISTFDTDYLLIKKEHLDTARDALKKAGHTVFEAPPKSTSTKSPTTESTATESSTTTTTTDITINTTEVAGFAPFALERYFAKHEFSAPYLLCCSDVEPLLQKELLEMADDECKQLWDQLSLGYTESQGLPLLREEIIKQYNSEVTTEDLLVIAPEEGIYLASRALLHKGDTIIVPWPCYQSLSEIAAAIGCTVLKWKPVEDENSGLLNFQASTLVNMIQKNHPKLVVVNFPHNPTGLTISKNDFIKIVDACKLEDDCWLFSDEMYRGLEQDSSTKLPSAIELNYDRTISLAGMSKLYGLPGLRIGWVISMNKKIMKKMCQLRDYTTICSSAPSEILSLIGLRNHVQLTDRSMSIIKNGLLAVNSFMKEHNDIFSWSPPTSGSISFPKLICGNIKATTFCDEIVEKIGVMLLPSSVYGLKSDDRVRLGFGRSNVPECLNILKKEVREVVEALNGKH